MTFRHSGSVVSLDSLDKFFLSLQDNFKPAVGKAGAVKENKLKEQGVEATATLKCEEYTVLPATTIITTTTAPLSSAGGHATTPPRTPKSQYDEYGSPLFSSPNGVSIINKQPDEEEEEDDSQQLIDCTQSSTTSVSTSPSGTPGWRRSPG